MTRRVIAVELATHGQALLTRMMAHLNASDVH